MVERGERVYYWLAFITGMLMPYVTGFLGLMPLDQSIIFEAGGRICRGELPFHDFYLPYGLVPSLLQSLFFKILGLNWMAYVTHAAIVNGLFAVLLMDALRMMLPGIKPLSLLAGSLLAAWAFYPMTGTPFLENHSLFFSFSAYWCTLAAFKRKLAGLLILSFPLLVLGFYSKPIPAIFWLLPVLLECYYNRDKLAGVAYQLLIGLMTAGFLLILPALVFPVEAFYYYTIQLPFNLGKGRLDDSFISRVIHSSKYFKLLGLTLLPLLVLLIQPWPQVKKFTLHIVTCMLLIMISVLFGVITKNAFYNVTTPVFIFAFTIFHYLLYQLPVNNLPIRLYRKLNMLIWLVLIASISVLNFRRTIDINFHPRDLQYFSEKLDLFVKTPLNRYSKNDIEKLKNIINSNHTLYTGDMQFLFALSGCYNPLPLTHVNNGTTYNSRDSIQYLQLKKQLLQNLIKKETKLLVEDESIYNPDQDLVKYLGKIKGKRLDSFAGIVVYQLDSIKLQQLDSSLNTSRDR